MKQTLKRLTAALLIAALLTSIAGATSLGSFLRQDSLELSDTAMLTHAQLANSAVSGGTQTEHIITYEPESGLRPIVAFGTTLYGRSDLNYVADYVAGTGKTVVAGVNGSFFDMSTGIPLGCVITEGILRTSGDAQSVGFRSDGTAVIGKPGVSLSVTYPNGNSSMASYNKALTKSNGVILYSRDYDTRTKNTISAYNVVLRPEAPVLTTEGTVQAEVLTILADTASCDIPEGCMVLSMATDTDYSYTFSTQISTLQVGDLVTVQTSISEDWKDVVYACGGGELLVEGGAANTAFTLDSAERRAARTAVGLKQDGTMVLYTMDGAQSGYSAGLTLKELAVRMEELGCEIALNLDGGGSTTLSTQHPGDSALTGENKPSDGKQRKCANFIFLVRETEPAGDAAHLHLYPYDGAVLSGSTLQMETLATDANYVAADLPGALTYTATGGTIDSSGMFTAGDASASAEIRVKSGSLSGTRTVRVVAEPSTVTVKDEATGKTVTGLSVEAKKQTELTAVSTLYGYTLTSQDTAYTWKADRAIGTIDDTGLFTAAAVTSDVTGNITCQAGGKRVTIPVTVKAPIPEGEAIHGFEPGEPAAVSGPGLTVQTVTDHNSLRYGTAGLRAVYNLTEAMDSVGRRQVAAELAVELPEDADTVGLWVCGDNSNNSLSLVFRTGETTASKWVTQLNFTGWKYVTAEIPAGAEAVAGFAVTEYDGSVALTGTIYLDQLIASSGVLQDTQPPEITAVQSGSSLTVTVKDPGSKLRYAAVTLDGALRSVDVSTGTGTLKLPTDEEAHQVKIVACDNVGNLASKTVDISGTLENPFADLSGHWSERYVSYCNREGILQGSTVDGALRFRPNDSMTRQEFAVALMRFLDMDTEDYQAVQLPFADSGSIAVWAQDAMRAAYAEGLITGSSSGGKLYANPKATITRQEAMAILGRTQEKGYAEDPLTDFSDASAVAGWAKSHIAAMVSRGIIAGSDGKLNPDGTVTRAQVAKILYSLY